MKKLVIPILVISLTILACSLTPTPPTESPPTDLPPTEPPTTEPIVTEPPIVTNVTCNELAIYLDSALASGYNCQTVPESPYEMEMYPAHTELALTGYPLAAKFFEPHISVYPVPAYTTLLPTVIPGRVAELRNLISSGSIPTFAYNFSTGLPLLPTFNAAQAFYAQELLVPFASGSGVRFLTEYAQYYVPVNNTDMFYTYQGLTTDELYWISVIMPVNLSILPADATNPPGGMSWEDFTNNYETYMNDMVNQLNAQAPGNYVPSLTLLDALVSSITITP